MKLSDLKLSTKFSLAVGLILLVFCIAGSTLLYFQLKSRVVEDAEEKTLVIMTQIAAVGDYIRGTLRPKMFEVFPKITEMEDFVVEALSTTHITQEVMKRFNSELKDYVYRRVSDNPLNSRNKADQLHLRMIERFRGNRNIKSWNGIVKIEGEEHLVRAKAILADKGCLVCHGNPAKAPKGIIRKYGRTSGFNWKDGDVVGVEAVTIPLAVTLDQIKGIAISTFIFGFATLLFLFMSLQGAFWRLVTRPLGVITKKFQDVVEGTEPLNKELPIETKDEVGEMTESFNQMAKHLYNAQENLRDNAETLRSIFEGISDPLALVKPDCALEITNEAYRDWVSKGINAVFTKECHSGDCNEDAVCPVCFFEKVKREKKALSEYWHGNDGRYYYIHFYPILDDNGEVDKAVQYVKDITDKMLIEEQMRKAERLAAVGQLSAGVAHEINNPLGGIRLCFNNLLATEMDEDTRKSHVEVINSGLSRIQDIVSQLLDFSKQSSLSISEVSINRIIDNVLRLTDYIITKKKINVKKKFSPDIPDIHADQNKMEQVFLNIILNAVYAVNGGNNSLEIATSYENGFCNITFTDNGPGIPDDVISHIFDPFFSTKPVGEGTGLGLSVSKSIVEQHNGRISVESFENGARFTVKLPASLK